MSTLMSLISVGSNVVVGKFSSKVSLASESQSRAKTTSMPESSKPREAPPQPEKKSNTFNPDPGADPWSVPWSLCRFMDEAVR